MRAVSLGQEFRRGAVTVGVKLGIRDSQLNCYASSATVAPSSILLRAELPARSKQCGAA